MSKPLIAKLEEAYNTGDLLEWISRSTCHTDLMPYLGYSKDTSKYVKIIRDFCMSKNIPVEDFFEDNRHAHLENRICPVCDKSFIVSKSNSKTKDKMTCSIQCANSVFKVGIYHPGYINEETYNKSHYREVAIKYYGEKCTVCGFDNPLAIVVHHKDMCKNNNKIENLQVLCANCHYIVHNRNFQLKSSEV